MKFLKSVIAELKKVKWPDKKYMVKYTIATLVVVFVLAFYFLGIDVLVALVKNLRSVA